MRYVLGLQNGARQAKKSGNYARLKSPSLHLGQILLQTALSSARISLTFYLRREDNEHANQWFPSGSPSLFLSTKRSQKLMSGGHDSSKEQVTPAETIPDSYGVLWNLVQLLDRNSRHSLCICTLLERIPYKLWILKAESITSIKCSPLRCALLGSITHPLGFFSNLMRSTVAWKLGGVGKEKDVCFF